MNKTLDKVVLKLIKTYFELLSSRAQIANNAECKLLDQFEKQTKKEVSDIDFSESAECGYLCLTVGGQKITYRVTLTKV